MAIAAYKAEKGKFPAKLEDLVPGYVREVPEDWSAAKPLIYRSDEKGYVLYSVGPNLKDEDGNGPEDLPKGDDIGVKVQRKQ